MFNPDASNLDDENPVRELGHSYIRVHGSCNLRFASQFSTRDESCNFQFAVQVETRDESCNLQFAAQDATREECCNLQFFFVQNEICLQFVAPKQTGDESADRDTLTTAVETLQMLGTNTHELQTFLSGALCRVWSWKGSFCKFWASSVSKSNV